MNKKLLNNFKPKRIYNEFFKDEVIKWELLKIKPEQDIIIRFIKTNSLYDQGILISAEIGAGSLCVNDVKGRKFELWYSTAPRECKIKCISKEGLLIVYNIYKEYSNATNTIERCSQGDYSGMKLEQHNNVYRYYCNNGKLDDEFDKLVFEVELL